MTTTHAPSAYTALPDEQALADTVLALILEIHQENPGRIHIVLIRQAVGF